MMDADDLILVGIIEADDCYARALRHTLQLLPDLCITAIWPDLETAMTELPQEPPDILLVDPVMPKGGGVDGIRRLKMAARGLKILVVTGSEEDEDVFDALRAGASGYLLKEESMSVLVRSILELVDEGTPVSGRIARKLVGFFNKLEVVADGCSEILTRREQEILLFLSAGKMYKEISVTLGIAMETTKKHVRNIYAKLQVQNRMQAVNKWRLMLPQYTTAMAS
jgi:NarL family two-component system response regulator LiaR